MIKVITSCDALLFFLGNGIGSKIVCLIKINKLKLKILNKHDNEKSQFIFKKEKEILIYLAISFSEFSSS